MRFLVLVTLLVAPLAASANCPKGNNAPLTAETNKATLPPAAEAAASNQNANKHRNRAQRTAYPH